MRVPVDDRVGCADRRRVPGDEGLANRGSIVTNFVRLNKGFEDAQRAEKIVVHFSWSF